MYDYKILRSDLIRLEVLKNEDVLSQEVAGNMTKRLSVYDEMFRRADQALNDVDDLILDATFVTQDLRRRAAEIASKHGLPLIIMETRCSQERSLDIICSRTKDNYTSNALTEEAYLANKAKFEPVDVDDLKTRFPQASFLHFVVSICNHDSSDWLVTCVEKR